MLRKCGITAAAYDEFTQAAHRLAQIWGETPGATEPNDYAQWRWQPTGCHLGSLKGHLEYRPWPRYDFHMGWVPGHPGKARVHITGEALPMQIPINQPAGLTPENNMNPQNSEEVGYIHVSRRIGGYPVYNFDHVLVVEAKGRTISEPVSRGEALQSWIQYAYTNEAAIERHKMLLARLTPEEQKQPAYLEQDGNVGMHIVTAADAKTDPIVRYSKSYFDKSLSPATPQLLTGSVLSRYLARPLRPAHRRPPVRTDDGGPCGLGETGGPVALNPRSERNYGASAAAVRRSCWTGWLSG